MTSELEHSFIIAVTNNRKTQERRHDTEIHTHFQEICTDFFFRISGRRQIYRSCILYNDDVDDLVQHHTWSNMIFCRVLHLAYKYYNIWTPMTQGHTIYTRL
jgi:hypothetical protein